METNTPTYNLLHDAKELADVPEYIPQVRMVYHRPPVDQLPTLTSSGETVELLRRIFNPETLDFKEHFWVILLTSGNSVLGVAQVGIGNANKTVVDIREILLLALLANAQAILLAHNHPSGRKKASEADIRITHRIKQACEFHDIILVDHVILTSESYSSMHEDALLD